MATTDLGACEWFVWDLRRSNLIDRGQLDQVVVEFLKKQPRAEPPELAEFLVGEGILSQFQAERLLQGKTQGLVLGPYTLMDALGSGSMGTVYKALNKNDNKWYAVKVLPRRSMWNVRIARRQVRSFEQCRHPSVVPFVDVGTSGGTHYLAWPLVEGVTIEAIVQQQGKLPFTQVAVYAYQTAEGLDICHQNGLIHGLLKPSNLMVGDDNQVRILDFGIGTLLAESEGESLVDTMSTANSLTSGLDCGSPESILEPTNRTPAGDQYSLGCVMYYCLTGQYPFPEGTAVEKMMCHQMKQPAPIRDFSPDVPDSLIAIVDHLMQKAPEARFAKTSEIIEALKPLVEGASVPKRPAVAARPAARPAPAPAPAPAVARTENGRSAPTAPASAPSRPAAPAVPAPRQAAPAPTRPTAPSAPQARPPAPPAARPTAPPAAVPRQAASAPVPRPSSPPAKPSAAPVPRSPAPPVLPSRDALRRSAPVPKARQPVVEDEEELEDEVEDEADDEQEEVSPNRSRRRKSKQSFEDRLGLGGMIVIGVLVAIIVFVLMTMVQTSLNK